MNAIFYSNDSTVEFFFNGAASGYNATIFCKDGHTCAVRCMGNACNNSHWIAGAATISRDCTYAELSEFCPNGTYLLYIFVKYTRNYFAIVVS